MNIDEKYFVLLVAAGGLFGSVLTVIISKLLEIFSKKSEFKRSLKYKYFERKIVIGESIFKNIELARSTLNQMNRVINDIISSGANVKLNPESNKVKLTYEYLEKLKTSYFENGDLLKLYFDIDEQILNTSEIESKINNLTNEINMKNFTSHDEALLRLKEIGNYINSYLNNLDKLMKLIRQEFRQYEI